MLDELGWDPLQGRQQQGNATMSYRIVYDLVCAPSTPYLTLTSVSATRGHKVEISCTAAVREHTHVLLSLSNTKIWNQLPQHTVSLPSLEAYKLLL